MRTVLIKGLTAMVAAMAALNATASLTETVYGMTPGGAIDLNNPLYSFDLPGSINLSGQSQTLLTYGDPSFQSWTPPASTDYAVDLSGDIFATDPGWYSFVLTLNGPVVTVTASPGEGGGTFHSGNQSGFAVYLPSGESALSFQYYNQGPGQIGAHLFVEGDDDITVGGPNNPNRVPDSSQLIFLAPGALCAAHALRRRFAKA